MKAFVTVISAAAFVAATAVFASKPSQALQAFSIVSCASTTACTGGNNNSTGFGVQGISSRGSGVNGQAKFASTTSTNGQSGVLGQDVSTSGAFDNGVKGTSVRGTGVLGSGHFGVVGSDNNTHGDNILANGHGGNLFRGHNSTGHDVFIVDNSGNVSDSGNLTNHGNFDTEGTSFIRGNATFGAMITAGGGVNLNTPQFGAQIQGGTVDILADDSFGATTDATLFEGIAPNGSVVFTVDNAGNVHAHSFTTGLAAGTRNGAPTYTTESASPMREDFGEATLVNGSVYVPLGAQFQAALTGASPYLVFITPQSPTRSPLYVTQKSTRGFLVRAGAPTPGNVVFDYRIVAKLKIEPAKPLQLRRLR